MIVVVVFMLLSTLNNAYDKRYKKDNTQISFKENSNIISTDRTYGCLNYLGETSSHIFLYDIEKRVSKIYSKSSISDFQIKDPGILDSLMFKIKRNPLIKSIVEEYSKK